MLFFLKALAIPVFYFVYKKNYGGLENFDAGKFYNDAKIINSIASTNFWEYMKLLLGFQDETPGTELYDNYLAFTTQWDNGRIKDYFYNDNRVVIRLHSLLHFVAFNSYHVHALFSCFLSFVGVVYLYKSIKHFFKGKEIFVLLVVCFLPALWFYTGALLKEGFSVFILGVMLYLLKKASDSHYAIKSISWLVPIILVSFFLKPYLLMFALLFFSFFFFINNSKKIKYKVIFLFACITTMFLFINTISISFKNKSILEAALSHQRVFADASKGGIFLLDSVKFVRLEFDSSLVKRVYHQPNHYIIKKNVSYIYWEHSHQQDTLYCANNIDTTTHYKLVYQLPKSGSNIVTTFNSKNTFYVFAAYLYYSLLYPFFFNASSPLQQLASIENLCILISIFVFIVGLVQHQKDNFPAIAFITFAFLLCLLIGLSTPNSGAIFRYRSPAIIFILLAALYSLPVPKKQIS